MKNQEWSSAKSKGKGNGVGNLTTGKNLEESLKRMGEVDKGHVGKLLGNDQGMIVAGKSWRSRCVLSEGTTQVP